MKKPSPLILVGILFLSSVFLIANEGVADIWRTEAPSSEAPVRASHTEDLRNAANNVRIQCGLTNFSYEDPNLVPGDTLVRSVHIQELREAVSEIYASTKRVPPEFTDPDITPGQTPIRAVHFLELQQALEDAVKCGDGFCTEECGESCSSCEADCGSCCGNGTIDPGEDCDGSDLNGQTCVSLGFLGGGTLNCAADCTFYTDNCLAGPECGNGTAESGEECDGSDLRGRACADFGFAGGGTLSCDGDCNYDTTSCQGGGSCGDGVCDAGEEECDGADLCGQTCGSLGYDGGLLSCSAACAMDTSGCFICDNDGVCETDEVCATCDDCCDQCGNGSLDAGETCDGSDLDGMTCASFGFDGGTLSCSAFCEFDTSQCFYCNNDGVCDADEVCATCDDCCDACGNGAIDTGEDCDGARMGGETCPSLGYDGGTLACADCSFDTANCYYCDNDGVCDADEVCVTCDDCCDRCGDGSIDTGEQCDGSQLGGAACADLGFDGGTLACSDCTYDTSNCYRCGDGNCDPAEDPASCPEDCACTYGGWADRGCEARCPDSNCAEGYMCQRRTSPDAGCDDQYQCVSDRDCEPVAFCGDGAIDTGEDCDGGNLGGKTCGSLGYDGGTLSCSASCEFDTSGCYRCGDGNCDPAEDPASCPEDCSCTYGGWADKGCEIRCPDSYCAEGYMCQRRTSPDAGCDDQYQCVSDRDCEPVAYCGDGNCDSDEDPASCPEDCSCTYGGWANVGCDALCSKNPCADGYMCQRRTSSDAGCDDEYRCVSDRDCEPVAFCGDGAIDPGEDCDGGNLGGETCISLGFDGGSLSCLNCTFNTSGCTRSVCGNGVIEPGERCDGNPDLRCLEVDPSYYYGGDVGCLSDCSWYEFSNCCRRPTLSCCGDGRCESPENETNCPEDCGSAEVCGDGLCAPGEICDADCCSYYCDIDCPSGYVPGSCHCECKGGSGGGEPAIRK